MCSCTALMVNIDSIQREKWMKKYYIQIFIYLDMCVTPADAGPCKSPRIRWAYNKASNKCNRFVYGGCFGSSNNFKSRKECESFCKSTSAVVTPN